MKITHTVLAAVAATMLTAATATTAAAQGTSGQLPDSSIKQMNHADKVAARDSALTRAKKAMANGTATHDDSVLVATSRKKHGSKPKKSS